MSRPRWSARASTCRFLIGGATTSRVHTAVKISPNYHRSQAIYVTDASRAVGVVSSLMSPEERPKAIARVREEYARMAESHARGRAEKARTSIADARANRLKLDWKTYQPPKPSFLGTRSFRGYDLAELARYIDWTPFFQAWELKGAYPPHSSKTTNMVRRRVRSSTMRKPC